MSVEHPFAQYVRILGKGKTGSRSLSLDEAECAMQMILRGEATAQQVGAFLMLLRVKEESAEEIAGFVKACRQFVTESNPVAHINTDIDWSSYAGKSKQPNWYVLSMLLLAGAGFRVFAHGARGHTAGRLYTQDVFETLNLPIARSWEAASKALDNESLCFMPLDTFCPPLHELIQLRNQFGLRSPVHTLCRLLNPTAAKATLQSVFHPSYSETHHQAAKILGEQNAMVIKGDAGEFELRPQARLTVNLLRNGESQQFQVARASQSKLEMELDTQRLIALWEDNENLLRGEEKAAASRAVTGTAALALQCLQQADNYEEALEKAKGLWCNRDKLLLNRLDKR